MKECYLVEFGYSVRIFTKPEMALSCYRQVLNSTFKCKLVSVITTKNIYTNETVRIETVLDERD